MKKIILLSMLIWVGVTSAPVSAQDSTSAFANCLVDSLNGKERKELAKWIFASMATHPAINQYAKITPQEKLAIDKYTGKLITRLLTDSCPQELKKASSENPQAIQKGFEFVGQVAMQELMTNAETKAALLEYGKYIDKEKLEKVLK